MPRVALLQPNADEQYGHRQGYASSERPPETGLAVLSSYLRTFAPQHEVVCLDPNKSDETLVSKAAEFDFVGFTNWFSNHRRVVTIAEMVKARNKETQVIVGGPNTSGLGKLLLEKYPFIDYEVIRDGEDALLGLVNHLSPEQIPNLWYRHDGEIKFTYPSCIDLNRLPLWDFSNFENLERRLTEYRKATAGSKNKDFDPWITSPLAMFSFRGCMKAIREGVCSYCSSAEAIGRALSPFNFWAELKLLEEKYGATFFYMADDVFTVSLRRMEQLAAAKPGNVVTPTIRAYAHMPEFILLDEERIQRMAKALTAIGVFNLFFGVESFGLKQITRANKTPVSITDSKRVIRKLGAAGIKTTMAYLLGLPGENEKSLAINLKSLDSLLKTGYVERIYLSVAMALRGTPMFAEFCRTPKIRKNYFHLTGKDLTTDDCPDYSLLERLGIENFTNLDPESLNRWLRRIIVTAERYLPPHRIGGFLLEPV